jgi:peptide/nickel transport system permease protein
MRFVARLCLSVVPALFAVSLITFFAIEVLPGNTAEQLAGANATSEQIERLEQALRLDRPPWLRYGEWVGGALVGDFGRSLANRQSVTSLIGERLPVTLALTSLALSLALATAVLLALISVHRPGGVVDRTVAILSMTGLSLAGYILGPLLILVFAVQLGILPSIGYTPLGDDLIAGIRSLILPATALAVPLIGLYTRFLRGDLLEQIDGHDYMLAARARGIGPWRALLRHALPNSLFGLMTLVGLHLGALLGGAVIVEQIFALPGIGQLLLQSVNLRDIAVVQAVVLLLATATVLANLTVDVLYAALDPRIRHGRA